MKFFLKVSNLSVQKSKLSICFVVTTPFAVNGFLINHLNRLAHLYNVSICVNLNLYPLSPALDAARINIINIPLERKVHLIKDIQCLWKLFKLFRSSKFDVIHSVTPKAGLLGMLGGIFCRIPNRFHTFTGQVWSNYSGFKRIFFQKIDRLIASLSTHTFADSNSQMQFLIGQGICNSAKISVLGLGSISGVDLKKFHPDPEVRKMMRNQYGCNGNDCIFLFVGRLTKDKGILDLVKAYELIKRTTLKSKQIFLWIVGPDEDGLQALVGNMPEFVDATINWLGPTFSPQDYMAAADILMLPSYREGFGTVIIEAGACGIPTVAYRIDGVIDAIQDNQTGLLCELGSVRALADSMLSLLTDEKLRISLGKAALQYAQDRFSSEVVTNAWISYYSSISSIIEVKNNFIKRAFDIILSLILIPILLLPCAAISLIVWVESGRPILFWSDRVGQMGRLFSMPKFRSMTTDAPLVATHLLEKPAAHLTNVGKFLRKSSLDEVPQIWSILTGDMSFVGPRPALFNQEDLVNRRNDLGVNRLKPGLTGWAQVNGRDEINLDAKITFDEYYLRHQSFWFDLRIIWLTFLKVIHRENISH